MCWRPRLHWSRRAALFWLMLAVGILNLGGCGQRDALYTQQSYVFGTLVEVSIYGEPEDVSRRVTAQVLADFDHLHQSLHAWKPSTVGRMNSIFLQSPARAAAAPGMIPIIEEATNYYRMSGGLFNPAIGKLVKLWGFQSDEFKPVLPPQAEIARLVASNPNMDDIVIEGIEAYSKNPDVQLDLGGYAKGYALDLAADYLRSQGIKNALINIGGNIIAMGRHGDRPWRVGIQHPRQAGTIATMALQDGEAVGTSGDYQRYFEVNGRRYFHIIDPRTGYPAFGTQAVTVVAPPGSRAGTLSDVASKPIFIAGKNDWREAARKMGINQAMRIDEDGTVYVTESLKARLEFTSPAPKVRVVP